MRRAALILVAVLILVGCGGADGGNSGASATTGGSTAGSTTATRGASAAAGDGGRYCREWQVRSPTINRLAMKAAMGPQPAGVEAALDGLDRERSALGAAAPDELKGDYQVLQTAWRHERDAAERAGWSPHAFRQAAAADLADDRYLAAVAHNLTSGGARVMAADLGGEGSENIRFVETDVTDEESVQNAVDTTLELGDLHGVINCAGVAIAEKMLGKEGPHSLNSFNKVVQVNLVGTFNAIRLAAAAMKDNEPTEGGERGVVVNTASVAAFEGQIGQVAYSASKGGVVSMTLPIARELASYGIRVATIAPGIFDTPMMAGLPEEARESLGNQVPFPSRLGKPEEYAALVRHMIENEMLNGEVIRLDGAIRMASR